MNPPPPPAETPMANSWSSSSCLSPVTAPISHDGTRTVTFTLVTSLLKSKLESIFLGVEKTIGSRVRTVSDVTPSKLTPPRVYRLGTVLIIDHIRSIEDNVRATCSELVSECIVVGNGRPSPALFVEASEQCTMDGEKLKEEIIRRTTQFHSRRYTHERIISTKHVIVVERGTLPRTSTKGNVRRQAVEDQYKELLNGVYGAVSKH